jgi:thiosulfate/3-mercaptopyruvate sulfurtransferase
MKQRHHALVVRLAASCATALTWLALAQSAAAAPHLEMLVSTEWLAAHGGDAGLVILHVGIERKTYDEAHIPDAQFLPWSELAVSRNGVPYELPPVADLVRLFERCGVSNRSRVVLYGDMSGLAAARAFFTLDYLGLGARTAMLDGGLEKWRTEQRPLSQAAPPERQGRLTPKVRAEALIELDELRRIVKSPPADVVIVDTRSPGDYAGTAPNERVTRRGHIPGARNVHWRDLLTGVTLAPKEKVRSLYRNAGVTPGKTAIVYCDGGVGAAFNYFSLRYLGYKVRLYDGSMWQWSRTADTPVVNEAAK